MFMQSQSWIRSAAVAAVGLLLSSPVLADDRIPELGGQLRMAIDMAKAFDALVPFVHEDGEVRSLRLRKWPEGAIPVYVQASFDARGLLTRFHEALDYYNSRVFFENRYLSLFYLGSEISPNALYPSLVYGNSSKFGIFISLLTDNEYADFALKLPSSEMRDVRLDYLLGGQCYIEWRHDPETFEMTHATICSRSATVAGVPAM